MSSAVQHQERTLIPQHGRIKGGPLDGWLYALVKVVDDRAAFQVYLHVMATDPAWPFPKLVKLRAWVDFDHLVRNTKARLVREQPAMLDWDKLLADAVQLALDAEIEQLKKAA